MKKPISYCALNVFMGYMCSTRFDYDHEGFVDVAEHFDFIFDDINNGHPTDFLPWTAPFFKSYTEDIHRRTSSIREFILKDVIKDRCETFDSNNITDLLDALLDNHFVSILLLGISVIDRKSNKKIIFSFLFLEQRKRRIVIGMAKYSFRSGRSPRRFFCYLQYRSQIFDLFSPKSRRSRESSRRGKGIINT